MMVASVWLISPFKGVIFFFIEVVWRNSLRREKTLESSLGFDAPVVAHSGSSVSRIVRV